MHSLQVLRVDEQQATPTAMTSMCGMFLHVTSRPAPPSVSLNANQTTHDHGKKNLVSVCVCIIGDLVTPPPPRNPASPHPFSVGDRKPGDTRMSDRRRIRGEMAAKNWSEIKWIDKEPRGEG